MRKYLSTLITFALVAVTISSISPSPSLAQASDSLAPRFGTSAAIILRPDSLDLYFTAHLTDDGQSVIGYSTEQKQQIYIWDISDLADDILYRDPQIIDLTTFMPQDFNGEFQWSFQSDTHIIMQVDDSLLQIDILNQMIVQSTNIPVGIPLFSSLSVQNSTVVIFFDDRDASLLWNTASNDITPHAFDDSISSVSAFRDGWRLVQSNQDAPNVNFFCDVALDTCIRHEVWGNLALDFNETLIFADNNPYSTGQDIPTTYYTFDPTDGLSPTETPFPNVPPTALPISVSPDEQFMLTLTYDPDSTLMGPIPSRHYEVWAIDGDAPRYSFGYTYRPFWFGDHFLAHSPTAEIATLGSGQSDTYLDIFSIYEMRGKSGLPYDGLYDFLGGYHETPHLHQISPDGTRYLHILGGGAIVLPIEYQAVDDLLTVEDTIFSVERGQINSRQVRLSPDGQTIVGINADNAELSRWDVDSGETASLDLSPYLTDDSVFDFALRDADVFLQIDNVLYHILLADLSIMDEFMVADTLTDIPPFAYVVPDQPSVAVNGDAVAALFDHSTVVWQDGEFSVATIGGMRLYPHADGWMIYNIDVSGDGNVDELTRCDITLTDCTLGTFEGPLGAIRDDDMIVGGNSLLGFIEYGIPPTYWELGPDSITLTDPIFELPSQHYVPASFHNDYALVAAPAYDYDNSGRHYELWSMAESRRLTHHIFRGDWEWLGDYAIVADGQNLTIVHLPDGRFTRWRADNRIGNLQLSADGTRLLVVSFDSISIVDLIE